MEFLSKLIDSITKFISTYNDSQRLKIEKYESRKKEIDNLEKEKADLQKKYNLLLKEQNQEAYENVEDSINKILANFETDEKLIKQVNIKSEYKDLRYYSDDSDLENKSKHDDEKKKQEAIHASIEITLEEFDNLSKKIGSLLVSFSKVLPDLIPSKLYSEKRAYEQEYLAKKEIIDYYFREIINLLNQYIEIEKNGLKSPYKKD